MFTKEQGVTVLGVIVAYEMLIISRCNFAFPKSIFPLVRYIALCSITTVL